MNVLFVCLGLGLLTLGGEVLIRGALGLAHRFNVSPLLCGLVIVGFGTSAPELAVSVDAALHQQPDIAVGNVVGSNIGNILLILGLCAVIKPLAVHPDALFRDAIVVMLASVVFVVMAFTVVIGLFSGGILLVLLAAYLTGVYLGERGRSLPSAELHESEAAEINVLPGSLSWTIACVVGGLLLLIGGSRVLLIGATGIAQGLGVSEAVIGLTLVAVGTSLPELSVSVVATFRGHLDVAVGNVLGSNIFNLLGILGVSALLQPLPLHERIFQFDQWVMLGSAVLLWVFLYTGRSVGRLEGGTLLAAYLAYLWASFSIFG